MWSCSLFNLLSVMNDHTDQLVTGSSCNDVPHYAIVTMTTSGCNVSILYSLSYVCIHVM